MFCPKCATENPDEAQFCGECGFALVVEGDGSTALHVKANAIELLRKELASKRVKGPIGLGSMNDPYMPLEREVELTRRALSVIAEFRFPVHIVTKSDLVLRDLDLIAVLIDEYSRDTIICAKLSPVIRFQGTGGHVGECVQKQFHVLELDLL